MKIKTGELKFRARRSLWGNYGTLTIIQLAITVCAGIFIGALYLFMILFVVAGAVIGSGVPLPALFTAGTAGIAIFLYLAYLLLASIIGAGYARIMLDMCLGMRAEPGRIFFAFRNHFLKFTGITLLMAGAGILGSLPSLLWSFSLRLQIMYGTLGQILTVFQWCFLLWFGLTYGLAYYILLEDTEKGVFQCMRESRELMRGNRIRRLLMGISFAGWYVLIWVTLGIGSLWVLPYISCTSAHFYLDLRERRRLGEWGYQAEKAGMQ